MVQEDDERTAKQNRWGSLAARLEVQCEDVLFMETEDAGPSSIREQQPAQQNGDAGISVANGDATPPPDLRRSGSAQYGTGPFTDGSHPSVPYQQQRQQNEVLQPPTHEEFQQPQPLPASPPKRMVTSLKDWIVTKKIDMEIKEATSTLPVSNIGMNPHEKLYIEKCAKIAHILVAHLAKNFGGANKNNDNLMSADSFDAGTDDWEPKPQDIHEDCITVTEDEETGDIVDVGFDIFRNFDWDHDSDMDGDCLISSSDEQKLGLIFEALGKLLYNLFMGGGDVPCPTSTNTPLSLLGEPFHGEGIAIPNEDDILDMFRKLPKNDDLITSTMRSNGNIPMPLCCLVTDILHTSEIMRGNGCGSLSNEDASSCFGSLFDVYSDIQQMIDFPDAFLFASITSRWELVFGNNHMFGRKKELQQLMDAAYRVQVSNAASNLSSTSEKAHSMRRIKEAIMVSGHAGSGKSRLVREIRKPLQAQGWLFLRCKFGNTTQSEPLSVIALGLDEYFSSSVVCCRPAVGSQNALVRPFNDACSCSNVSCPRRVCHRLETLIGLDGLKCLSQQMPSLGSLIGEAYAHRRDSLNNINGGLRGKLHTHLLFGTLLDTLASFSPVLFFVDDVSKIFFNELTLDLLDFTILTFLASVGRSQLQWADDSSLELLTGLINRAVAKSDEDCNMDRLLFVGAYRTDNIVEEHSLTTMIKEFEACDTINMTQISLHGFQMESLNEMVSEALCLPRRKTKSLSQIIHLKTQGFPLFVVEFLDALWTEKLLIHNQADGWEWDVDAIDLKGISKSVAELLTCKLKMLRHDVLSGIQVLSCFRSHVDFDILEAVQNYDGRSSTTMIPALHTAQEEGLVEKAGPTYTFAHDLIQQAAFELIPSTDRVPLLQKLVSCLIPCCMQEGGSGTFLFVTVDLINKIGSDAVSNNPTQSQLFARLNLEAGKKSIAMSDFSSAVKHFNSGISFLCANYWEDQYELSLNLFENSALANYSEGNHEQVVIQVNHVLSNAKSFEDKFKSYCVFVNIIALGSTERAIEKLYDLLRTLGENIDPNTISPQIALGEFLSTREILSGGKKDVFMHLFQMTDQTKLMTMKLMSMLVLYYSQERSFMTGYLVCKMIRISLQYGHCEDTVFALAIFATVLVDRLIDIDEGYALGRTSLSLMKFYNTDNLIPRIYGILYGTVFISKDPLQSLLDPLLKACRLSFSSGNFEHSCFNTILYTIRSWNAGKKIHLILNELNAFAHQHKQQSHMTILQLFLAPSYKTLCALSGTPLDSSELLAQLAAASTDSDDDIIEAAKVKNEMVLVQVGIVSAISNAFFSRDFAKASQFILKYQDFFDIPHTEKLPINKFEGIFIAGLVSFHMARETREAHWMEKGTSALAAFEKWSKLNEWNFEHRYLLLKAELHHTKGETSAAAQAYDLSAEAAVNHQFIHQLALTCELAAHYFGNIGANERTREMVQRSHDAYMEWGATRKAKSILNLLDGS
ncbi:hypothetical protein ACHAXR_011054 [Thalassiosira sp. AJA248-18]